MPDAAGRAAIKARVAQEGPLCSQDFEADAPRPTEMWARPGHKLALDYMWYAGELGTCHRRGFTKMYDVAERIFPPAFFEDAMAEEAQVAGLCTAALDRMGFGTLGEVRKFWDAAEVAEVKAWGVAADLVPLRIEAADGQWFDAVGPADIEARLDLAPPTSRLRILNPFDPVIRDRVRLKRLFGFDYRNEMFVPKDKRQFGYYVFPLLEGDRLVGRLEAKAFREADVLTVLNLWPEPGVAWTIPRQRKLEAELSRLARFVGVNDVTFSHSESLR
ncbi:MAG: crosslink repair DNA glycosylase YcaQ family protein [Pseudomonadota bacterium]